MVECVHVPRGRTGNSVQLVDTQSHYNFYRLDTEGRQIVRCAVEVVGSEDA